MYTLQFDGMLRSAGNEFSKSFGLLGYGWLITWNEMIVAHGFGVFLGAGKTGSNAAEYLALIDGLEALSDLQIWHEPIQIRGDAKCVIDQMLGLAGVSSPLTKQLNDRARKLAGRFHSLTWLWVPRRDNRIADSLSRRSFRYLHYAAQKVRRSYQAELPSKYGGNVIPLVDLRVHAPPQGVRTL